MELRGRNITVFDLEIKQEIGKNGIGWRSFDKMGISVGCSYNFMTCEYKVFMDDNLEDLYTQIESSELAVGFNILDFDNPLLEATLNVKLTKDHHYDILVHSRLAHGSGNKLVKGFKLDNHLAGTFGPEHMKTGNGADAPVWWQERKLGRLISYCLDDVKREAKLFQHIWQTGTCKLDTHGELFFRKHPLDFLNEAKGKQLVLV